MAACIIKPSLNKCINGCQLNSSREELSELILELHENEPLRLCLRAKRQEGGGGELLLDESA